MTSNVRATLEPKKQDNIRDILQGEALWDRPNMGTSKTAQNREVRSLEQLQIHPKCASILKVQRIHGHIQCGSINAKHSLQKNASKDIFKESTKSFNFWTQSESYKIIQPNMDTTDKAADALMWWHVQLNHLPFNKLRTMSIQGIIHKQLA